MKEELKNIMNNLEAVEKQLQKFQNDYYYRALSMKSELDNVKSNLKYAKLFLSYCEDKAENYGD